MPVRANQPMRVNGASLVPDISQALNVAMGIAKERKAEKKQQEADEIAAGIPTTGTDDILSDPENIKRLQRLYRLDPELAKFTVGLAGTSDKNALEKAQKEAKQASVTYGALVNAKPENQQALLGQIIKEREAKGEDTTKLRELVGMKPDEFKLAARGKLIAAGDVEGIASGGLKGLKEQMELQKLQLEMLSKQQDMALKSKDDQRKDETHSLELEEVAEERQEKAKQAEGAEEEAHRALDIASRLLKDDAKAVRQVAGKDALLPTFRQSSIETEQDIEELSNLLTVGNLGRMSGVLSESDIKLLKVAATGGLDLRSEPRIVRKLQEIQARLANSLGVEIEEEPKKVGRFNVRRRR